MAAGPLVLLSQQASRLRELVSSLPNAEAILGPPPGRRHRRSWAGNGRAHIEVRGLETERASELVPSLVAMIESLEGVGWARVVEPLGRVVVAFDEKMVTLGELIDEVEAAEREHGLADLRFPGDRPDHPGDAEALRRSALIVATDTLAFGGSVLGLALGATPIPVELASVISFMENQPRLRRAVENAVGPPFADLLLALANATVQVMAQGPVGLAVDSANHVSVAAEQRARQACWERREPKLAGDPAKVATGPAAVPPRPSPLPAGPIEQHGDRAVGAAIAGAAATFATTRQPRRATAAAVSAVPKAARTGRLAFGSQLGRSLARRGVVVFDSRALERLDRVDTVVAGAEVLDAGGMSLRDLAPLRSGADPEDLSNRFHELFRGSRVREVVSDGELSLGPVSREELRRARAVRAAARMEQAGLTVLALSDARGPAALIGLAVDPHHALPAVAELVQEALWPLHVVGDASPDVRRIADAVHPDDGLGPVVRALQSQGHVVLALSMSDAEALAAADCGVGVLGGGDPPPWGAHLIAPDLDGAAAVIEGATRAGAVSRRSVGLAWAGSAAGGIAALGGRGPNHAQRALLAVNGAAAAAFVSGTVSGMRLGQARRPEQIREEWHSMPADRVLQRLATPGSGLEEATAASRKHGKSRPRLALRVARSFTDELRNPLTPLLAGGAALSVAAGSVVDAAIIASVTGLGASIGTVQRLWTDRAVAGLAERTANQASVIRDGEERRLPSGEVVVGDLLLLRAGDVVPADARILSASGLEIDESALTGESAPVEKQEGIVFSSTVAERSSMVYEGTTVVAGSCRAVVVATGDATEAGQGASTIARRPEQGLVEARIADLTKLTMPAALGGGAAVLLGAVVRGRDVSQAMQAGIALAVASVPEGLPFVVTAAQLAAARRLSERGTLVKRPRTIEALGRCDVLCFDKTGTLTEGRLSLQALSDGLTLEPATSPSEQGRAVLAAALRATPEPPRRGRLPHPTDQAVVEGARSLDVDVRRDRPRWQRQEELGFEPRRSFHTTWAQFSGGWICSVKGAPETVVEACTTWRVGGRPRILDGAKKRELARHVMSLASEGFRVLAVAESAGVAAPADAKEDLPPDLELYGFVCLADVARERADEAVDRLRAAGVHLLMLTGDHPETARAVAEDLGLLDGGRVVTGDEIERMGPGELAEALPSISVCARVTPHNKAAIVSTLKRTGRTVAMTGDGANDAPAIRMADVGIALGPRSTASAKDAADMVVTDTDLETLLDALVEGRATWGAVRDALSTLLGGNLGEIGFTVAATLLSGRSPLSARQLLLVNLLTDLAPALAVAARAPKPEAGELLLGEGPDRSLGDALNREILVRAGATAGGALGAWAAGRVTGRPARASTMALVAVVMTQLGQTIVTGEADRAVLATGLGSGLVLAAIVQTPGVSQAFGCTPLGPIAWGISMGSAVAATAAAAAAPRLISALGAEQHLVTRRAAIPQAGG